MTVLNSVLTNRVPPDIIPSLSSNWFVPFFNGPSDHTKLRPIGIGTSWRRLAGDIIPSLSSNRFVAFSMVHLTTQSFDPLALAPHGDASRVKPSYCPWLVNLLSTLLPRANSGLL
jgi:hypothetical protein